MYFEDFSVGQTFKVENVRIEKERIFAFAREYDPLRMHLDEEYAKSTVYGGLIAPGIMSFMLVWAEYARLNLWDDALIAGKSTSVVWHAPVYAGDVLSGVSEVTGKTPKKNGTGILEVNLKIFNQDGRHVISDTTELVLKCGGAMKGEII